MSECISISLQAPACPRCNNKDAYVTRLEPATQSPTVDIVSYHCGKCAHLFEAMIERPSAAIFSHVAM